MEIEPLEKVSHTRSWHLARILAVRGIVLLPLALFTLAIGMSLYHWVEGLEWADSFLNASMLLGGMGPIAPIKTDLGKWLIGAYALVAGLLFLALAAVILGPVFHHVLKKFHLEQSPARDD